MFGKKQTSKFSKICFRILRGLIKFFYPKIEIVGLENLPKEASIIVGNHSQMNGPIIAELYFPPKKAIWCAGQMMEFREVPQYSYQDFWCHKPKYTKWFYKLLSYIITPFSVCLFNNAHTIAVYRDSRILSTFRNTIKALKSGNNVIIFPECPEEHNNIVNKFQDRFIDVAKYYYKKTGKSLSFVPMYIAPKLKKAYIGKPIEFNPDNDIKDEFIRITDYLMKEITSIAVALPEHTVVPYNNISKSKYKKNK